MGELVKRRRVALVSVAALAVVGVGGLAAREVRNNMVESQGCAVIQGQTRAAGEVVHVSDGQRRIAVLGDSYSAGDGLDDRRDAWTYDFGRLESADVSVAGVGATGYTNGGVCKGQEFRARVGKLLALSPDVLVIQGGLNDSDATPESIESAARELLAATAAVPDVIVVGPTNAPAKSNLQAVDGALARAASSAGRKYVSALGWELEFLPDRLHLTPAGHDKFAEHVARSL